MLEQSYEKTLNSTQVALVDDFIDSCTNELKNSNDEKVYNKYNQLSSLGFYNVFIYTGGLFEWLMLQDIYGENEFPTTKKELDILKYKANKVLNVQLLEY